MKTVNFLHIPKTGGTAIKHVLKNKNKNYNILLKTHDYTLVDVVNSNSYGIFILRDPIERFISAFNSRLRKGQPRYNTTWTAFEEKLYNTYNTPNDLAENLYVNKFNFNLINRLQQRIHFKNLSYWLNCIDYVINNKEHILYVGFLDTLNEDFNNIIKILKLDSNLKLPTDDINSHKTPNKYSKYLSDDAIKNLQILYKEDLEFYTFFYNNKKMFNKM